MGGLCLPIRRLGWEAWVSGKQCLILPKQSPQQQRVLGEIRMKGRPGEPDTTGNTLLSGSAVKLKQTMVGTVCAGTFMICRTAARREKEH